MEAYTIQKYIHRTPRKLRLVADMVRKMEPTAALNILQFTPNHSALDLSAAINTALANARIKGMGDNIYFKSIEINEAPSLKRMRPGTKGRAKLYKKRMSHIKIILSDDLKVKEQKPKVKIVKEKKEKK